MHLHNLPSNKAIMNVEFENAFSSVRSDNHLCSQELHSKITACKSELICNDCSHVQGMHMLSTLKYVNPDQAVLLESPLRLQKVVDSKLTLANF